MKKKIAIFISGRGSNMKAIVEQCRNGILKNLVDVEVVFANKEDAAGLDYARSMGIRTKWISSKGLKRSVFDQKVIDFLDGFTIDYIILAGYMRVLSGIFVNAFSGKIINIHPADTFKHQGLHAYEWAFNNNLQETKITVHYVDEGMDTGAVISQHIVDLKGVQTLKEVEERGLKVEHKFYSEIIRMLILNETN
ncbi:MAG: phosphoribosylglycinamide formyltransferase [Saprospiraceae bacterium]|nr:phosphoribosylglycinamide formyltransferase [Saprospiraceae bacterium]